MHLINLTAGTLLANQIEVAGTFKKRLKGLLGRSGLQEGEAMVITPCSSVHTFFMKFPIDVLFVDKDFTVLRALENMAPNRVSPVVARSRMAVELFAGRIAASKTRAGDRLQLLIKEATS